MSSMPPSPSSYRSAPTQPPSDQVAETTRGTDGKLMVAGIMMIIQAAATVLIGLWLFTVTTSDLGDSDLGDRVDSLSGGTVTFLAIVFTLFGLGILWTGIGAVRGRGWARITTIVLQSIFLVLTLFLLPRGGSVIIPLAWGATVLGLAIAGKPKA